MSLHPSVAPADLVRDMKANSSRWLKGVLKARFGWQSGYAVYGVSASRLASVRRYISTQAAHHKRMTFAQEYIAFLERHGVPYDPRYVFD